MRYRARRLVDILAPDRNNFAALRLLLAVSVLVSHGFYLATGSGGAEPLRAWTGQSLGVYAVQVFFVLSGVLVTQSVMRSRDVLDYSVARALRIFPALIVSVFVTAFLIGSLVTRLDLASYVTDPGLLVYLARTLSLSVGQLPGVFLEQPVPQDVNISLWTLRYEALCYAALAAMAFVYLRLGQSAFALWAALALWLAFILSEPAVIASENTILDHFRYFAVFFGVGVAAYSLRDALPITAWALPPLFLVFVLTLDTSWAALGSAVFLGYAALYFSTFDIGGLRALTNTNDLSYGIYIYAFPVSQALIALRPGLGSWSTILLSLTIVVPIAYLSWIMIERPSMRARRRIVALVSGREPASRLRAH